MTQIGSWWAAKPATFTLNDWVLVDIETTGGKPGRDEIIEIAVQRFHDGEWVQSWQQLIRPQRTIPPWITRLTGITNAMVADAPRFNEIADELAALLADKVFVAHNARFDYGFIKHQFKQLGLNWRATTLCTVKLSKQLFPQYPRHGLDHLVARYDLPQVDRHRAMGDVELMVAFLAKLSDEVAPEQLWSMLAQLVMQPSLPAHLDPHALDECDDVPGVYRFYGESGRLLYVGKSVQLRTRILNHFNPDQRTAKNLKMLSEIHHIDWTECEGDLTAQLLESKQIKALSPKYNVKLRKQTRLWRWVKSLDKQGYAHLRLVASDALTVEDLRDSYGLFRSQKQAEEAMRKKVKEANLCQRLTGLEKKSQGACFAYQLKQCRGPCVQEELPQSYNLRQDMALLSWQQQAWPWPGPVLVRETAESERGLVIYQWQVIAEVVDDSELAACLASRPAKGQALDLDSYRILCKFLLKPPKGMIIQPLEWLAE
ncbi:exonuclease domain-containing protein [Thiomicrospira sp. ALE5]|uniref:exonuclease domain-containing protein n=1 Tax=Thiomicrospira sp. ALE5 TaxID=748650 RepID=UPI0008EE92DC|nr:exonuclease domain-containing protein [Thiomicrospira sp. ALE5]SFR49669.1 DNA polymerase-3 subunit epsilon [Thiomicrospira sp. ALE5]